LDLVSPTSVEAAVDLTTIGIVFLALYYVVRQRLDRMFGARTLLVTVYMAFAAGMTLEFLTDLTSDHALVTLYAFGEVSLILLTVMLLTATAYAFYLPGLSLRERVGSLFERHLAHGILFVSLAAYFLFLEIYLVAARPFTIADISIGGTVLAEARFDPPYLLLLCVVLVAYVSYPLLLFLKAGRKTGSASVRKAMVVLPLSWTAIGVDLLAFNGFLLFTGEDAIILGHLLLAAIFGVTAAYFRNATLLGNIFGPITQVMPATNPFTGALGVETSAIGGKSILLEVDAASRYDQVVRDFTLEQISHKAPVFVFTFAGSPILAALSAIPEARFYVATGSVSYAQQTDAQYKVLVPQYNRTVMLDLIDKTVSANPETEKALVYDNISDLIVYAGPEAAIKLLREMLEILAEHDVTSLFLISPKAHDQRTVNLIRNLFANLLYYDKSGFRRIR